MHIPPTIVVRLGIHQGITAICLMGALLAAPAAWAVPFTSDLSISGSVGFDDTYATSSLSGTGTQAGSFSVTQGGAPTSSTFNNASVTGSNPLNGTLTDLGDGFGFSGRASASGANQGGTYGIGIDTGLNLTNNSTNTYKITFNIDFYNEVDSAGTDAYASSNFSVFDRANNLTLFYTDFFTDTVNGNEVGGQATGDFGGQMTDKSLASFAITLLAGQTVMFDPSLHDLAWTLEGGAYSQDGSSSALLEAFLSIASVENLTQPPNPTPEPATLALLGIGLAGLGALRRRGSR